MADDKSKTGRPRRERCRQAARQVALTMPLRDPIRDRLRRTRLTLANAERTVSVLEAEVSRKMVAPKPGTRFTELQNILQERIAARDKLRQEVADLISRPRWVIEQREEA